MKVLVHLQSLIKDSNEDVITAIMETKEAIEVTKTELAIAKKKVLQA